MSPRCLPLSLSSIRLTLWEMSFEEFEYGHDDSNLGYQNARILAILNLYVALMLPIIFQFNPTFSLGRDVPKRISGWRPWRQSWILDCNNFRNSESPCCPNVSYEVTDQLDIRFRRRCVLKNIIAVILDNRTKTIEQF